MGAGYPITITVTQPNGTPAAGQPVSVTTSATLAAPTPPAAGYVTDGAGQVQVVLADTVAGHEGTVQASVAAGGQAASGNLVVQPGAFASFGLGGVAQFVTAGTQVSGVINVFDAEGNATNVGVPAFCLDGSVLQTSPNATAATWSTGVEAGGQIPVTFTPTFAQVGAVLTVSDVNSTATSSKVDVGPAPPTDAAPGSLALAADPTDSRDCTVAGQTATVLQPKAACVFLLTETDFYGNDFTGGSAVMATLAPGGTPDGGTLTLAGTTSDSDIGGASVTVSGSLASGTSQLVYKAPSQLAAGGTGQILVSDASGAPFAITPGPFQVNAQTGGTSGY